MKVLVTGHTGYVGTVMAQALTEAGHEVTGLDTGYFADRLLGPAPDIAQEVCKDLRDVRPQDCAGFDSVVHLAALSNDPLGSLAPQITYDINHLASVRLAQAAKAAGVTRFLYASTCSVYGTSGGGELVDEQATLCPITPYAESKVQVEAELDRMADDSFSPTCLRNATAFGYSPRLRADIVLNNLVGWAMLTGIVKVLSDGTPWRPLVHVRDMVAAFLAVLESDREQIHNEAFNVGWDTNNVTVRQIAEQVARVVSGSSIEITGESGGDPRSYRVDFSKMTTQVPAYQPQWTITRGAAELYEKYQEFGLTERRFTSDFTRLAVLRQLMDDGRIDEATLRWR